MEVSLIRIAAKAPSTLRRVNKSLILDIIRDKGPISRAELSRVTGFSRSTVSQITAQLCDEGLVHMVGIDDGHVGRRAALFELNNMGGYVIGLDIGGTSVQCRVADLGGNSVRTERWQFDQTWDDGRFLEGLLRSIDGLFERVDIPGERIKSIGVAVPGIVNPNDGIVTGATPNVPNLTGLGLADLFSEHFGVPVAVENDVNAALLGEHRFGAARGRNNVFFMVVGTGVGGALLLDGHLYRGTSFGAGEVGYWLMSPEHLDQDWQPHGCLELLASGRSIGVRGSEEFGRNVTAKQIFALARDGDTAAHRIVERVGRLLGQAVSNICSLLDVEMVVLGGGVMLSGDLLLPIIRRAVEVHAPKRDVPVELEIVTSSLGDEAGVYGAVQIALERAIPSVSLHVQGEDR